MRYSKHEDRLLFIYGPPVISVLYVCQTYVRPGSDRPPSLTLTISHAASCPTRRSGSPTRGPFVEDTMACLDYLLKFPQTHGASDPPSVRPTHRLTASDPPSVRLTHRLTASDQPNVNSPTVSLRLTHLAPLKYNEGSVSLESHEALRKVQWSAVVLT